MSNKKRIIRKAKSLKKHGFSTKDLSKFIRTYRNASIASDHATDALVYLIAGLKLVDSNLKCVIDSCKGRDVNILTEYQYGIDFANQFVSEKYYLEQVPARYNRAFIELVKVGFTAEDAFNTLKETYIF